MSSSPREFTMALAAAEDRPAVELVELTGRAVGPELISGRPGVHVVVVGDVDAWQAMWGLLPALRGRARLLFHRVGVADFRSISRSRRMPPALASPRHAWVVDLDDSVRRVALPHPHRATARSP